MILDKKIEVNITNRNKKYFIDKGYDCFKNKIIVDIEDLPKYSKIKIKVKCDICGKEKIITYGAYNKNIKNIKKYACSIECCQEKINKTNKIRYGCKRPLQNKKIRKKLEKTNKEKYGNKIASKNKNVKEKIRNITNNYINDNSIDFNKNIEKSIEIRKNKTFIKYKKLNILELNNSFYKIKCKKGHIYKISSNNLYLRNKYKTEICTICNPINKHESGKEIMLKNFIKNNYNDEIIFNSKKIINPYELDIFLPKLKIAFEFNGNYWHSLKDKNYHKQKSLLCKNNNIELINIWEFEWDNNNGFLKEWILRKIYNIENVVFNNDIINEYSIINNWEKYKNKKIKRFISHKINNCKLIRTLKPLELKENLFNEGYKIYKIL